MYYVINGMYGIGISTEELEHDCTDFSYGTFKFLNGDDIFSENPSIDFTEFSENILIEEFIKERILDGIRANVYVNQKIELINKKRECYGQDVFINEIYIKDCEITELSNCEIKMIVNSKIEFVYNTTIDTAEDCTFTTVSFGSCIKRAYCCGIELMERNAEVLLLDRTRVTRITDIAHIRKALDSSILKMERNALIHWCTRSDIVSLSDNSIIDKVTDSRIDIVESGSPIMYKLLRSSIKTIEPDSYLTIYNICESDVFLNGTTIVNGYLNIR